MSHQEVEIHSKNIGQEGRRVVFLHGLFGQGKNFTTIARALEPQFQSLLVDLPNHGRSGWSADITYVEMADQVAAELRSGFAAEGPIDLVGHSMGGKVAMALALRHPDLIRALVVVDISPAVSAGADEFEHLLGSLASLDLAGLERRGEADDQLVEAIPNPAVRGFLLQNLYSTADGWSWRPNLDLLLAKLGNIGHFPDFDGMNYSGPVLWLAGSESPYVQAEHEPTMRDLFPRTLKVVIKDSGHWVHSEQPEAFISALQTFLRD